VAGVGEAQAEAELDDEQFDDALERVMSAAAQALKDPAVAEQVKAVSGADDEAEALSTLALSIINALDDKSGESIPPDVLPAAALGVVGMIGEVIGSSQEEVGKAADLLMRKAAQEGGMSPEEIDAELAGVGE
jgi:hypothetical protein